MLIIDVRVAFVNWTLRVPHLDSSEVPRVEAVEEHDAAIGCFKHRHSIFECFASVDLNLDRELAASTGSTPIVKRSLRRVDVMPVLLAFDPTREQPPCVGRGPF